MTEEEKDAMVLRKKEEAKETEERLKRGLQEGTIVCVDCGFEDQMMTKEQKSLSSQLGFVYGRIRKTQNLFNLHLINFKGSIKKLSEDR